MNAKTRTVLITGGSSGIGLDAARAFYARGANVVLNGRNPEKLAAAAATFDDASRVATVAGNVGEKKTGQEMVRTAVERFGSVDVLINNAGIFESKPFLDYTEEDLDRHLTGNLKGAFFTSQAAVAQMRKQDGGVIINVGTVLVNHSMAGLPDSAPLVSKGGIHALTTNLASELAQDNIRVNTIAPGVIRTPLYGDSDVDAFGGIALRNRVGETQDTTDAILYLADADFVTGVTLNVDGGYTAGRPAA